MRDPHVEWLLYRMDIAPTTIFENPPAVELETPDFRIILCDAEVKFHMERHYTTVDEAQRIVAPFLRAWEIEIGLTIRPGEVRFVYADCSVIDRDPPQSGEERIVGLIGIASGEAFGKGGLIVQSRRNYPPPPKSFKLTPTVETLWQRYEGFVAGREPLSAMAYFCLTVIESTVGQSTRRRSAAKRYHICYDVLCKLGELTEKRGDAKTARKMHGDLVPHTNQELSWIEAAVKAIIRRVAEVEAGATVTQLGMNDLPPL